jgi:hypothetical protein
MSPTATPARSDAAAAIMIHELHIFEKLVQEAARYNKKPTTREI